MTVFGVTWDELTLEQLAAFLEQAPPEPLSWEAKEAARPDSVRKQVCGFANGHEVGYLILGAKQHDGAWSLDGVNFPNQDPPNDITNILTNGGVTPYPYGLEVRSFSVGDDRHVAVVRVPPTPTPPCNAGGTVYERVSGKTIPVTDSSRLAALFDGGDSARERATATAAEAAARALVLGRSHPPDDVHFALGLAAVGYGADLTTRPFTEEFMQGARSSVLSLLADDGPISPEQTPEISQDALIQRLTAQHRLGWSWLVQASRDGGIGVHGALKVQQTSLPELVRNQIKRAWACAEETLSMLEPAGERYLHVIVAGGDFPPNEAGARGEWPVLLRGGPLTGPTEDILASMQRELERATGLFAFEQE